MNLKTLYQKPLDALAKHFPKAVLAFTTFLWGFLITLPFDPFLASEGFSPLGEAGSVRVVGGAVAAIALLNLHSITMEWCRTAQYTATVLMVFWAFVGMLFLILSPNVVSWVLIMGLAWLFGWSAIDSKQIRVDKSQKEV